MTWWRAIALASALTLAAACGSGADAGAPDPGNQHVDAIDTATPELPVTVDSADGREVTVTDVSRVVPLAGSLSEIVVALGLVDNVAARDVSATFPEVADLPLVTRAHDVSAEAVLSVRPTLVLAQTDTGPPEALEHIRNAGVPVVVFDMPTSIDDVERRIDAVAHTMGVPGVGDELIERTRAEIADAQSAIPDDATPPRVAFLYMRGQAGVYLIAGDGSGADSMIEAAGAIDAGTAIGLTNPFTPITSEALVKAAPDVILMTTTGLDSVGGLDGLEDVPGIAQTPAGRDRRIVTVEDGLLYGFGSRTADALRQLIDGIYR